MKKDLAVLYTQSQKHKKSNATQKAPISPKTKSNTLQQPLSLSDLNLQDLQLFKPYLTPIFTSFLGTNRLLDFLRV